MPNAMEGSNEDPDLRGITQKCQHHYRGGKFSERTNFTGEKFHAGKFWWFFSVAIRKYKRSKEKGAEDFLARRISEKFKGYFQNDSENSVGNS